MGGNRPENRKLQLGNRLEFCCQGRNRRFCFDIFLHPSFYLIFHFFHFFSLTNFFQSRILFPLFTFFHLNFSPALFILFFSTIGLGTVFYCNYLFFCLSLFLWFDSCICAPSWPPPPPLAPSHSPLVFFVYSFTHNILVSRNIFFFTLPFKTTKRTAKNKTQKYISVAAEIQMFKRAQMVEEEM